MISKDLDLILFSICMLIPTESLVVLSLEASTDIIQGKYENKDLGIRLKFPAGWTGTITSLENASMISLTLSKQSKFSEPAASDFSTITLSAGKNLSSLNSRIKTNSLYENCLPVEKSSINISGREFISSFIQCPTIHYKMYYNHEPRLTVNYSYAALPSSFEAGLKDFDNSALGLIVNWTK